MPARNVSGLRQSGPIMLMRRAPRQPIRLHPRLATVHYEAMGNDS